MTKELNNLYEYGYQVFGDKTKFHQWLERKCTALGGRTPASYLISPDGIHILRQTLGRIEHGVIS
ncbi:MbcA/ParS/Xre antitoxin family protein [Galbibacter mesophilus]|uniref:MbcA/ParS/Xre antitoxin family protein n=1 Tax=Galbibacter mesophilus TaxID=379069 RepID=UPI00191D776C|nr:MbcA/ParS/Xre antitoxin family protein [Galbibacter mesophilus]MCM5664269.1 MbcA/ParS/Xre antitoxin family protein [Galbibacter mesophilus]